MAGFVFLPSYYDALRPLPDGERLALLDALLDYVFAEKEPDGLTALQQAVFVAMRPNVDKSTQRYSACVANGAKGGRPKNQTETKRKPNENQTKTDLKPSTNLDKEREKESEKESEKDSIAAKPPSASRFSPPTIEQVRDYCVERGNAVNAEQFVDFYSAKGWRIGNQPMKDWRAAVRTWERREQAGGKQENDKKYDYSNDVDFLGR